MPVDTLPRDYISDWPSTPGVCIADGAAVKITVERGQLVVNDGIAGSRRERKFSRITRDLKRLLILTPSGYISLQAIAWLADSEIPWCQLSKNTGIQAMSAPQYQDSRLLRTQARACRDGDLYQVALEITRYLITQKIEGQLHNVSRYFMAPDTETYLKDRLTDVECADNLSSIRSAEGQAASAYWQAWSGNVHVPFTSRDRERVPEHWLIFRQRQTLAMFGERNINASDPINAALNYLYKIGETEAVHACHTLGLSPILGTDHADKYGRNSLALDLLESIRPAIDAIVLARMGINGEIPCDPTGKPRYFDRRLLVESKDGIVRLIPPYTHELAGNAVQLSTDLAPHAARIAMMLTDACNGKVSPKPLMKSVNAMRRESKTRRYYPKVHLRQGAEIIPDSLWETLQPVLTPRATSSRGRAPDPPTRELCAAMVARYVCRVPWSQVGIKQDTAQKWLKSWQDDGTWPKVKALVEAHGHLADLIS